MNTNFHKHFTSHYFLSLKSEYNDNFNFKSIEDLPHCSTSIKKLELSNLLNSLTRQINTRASLIYLDENPFFYENLDQFEYMYNQLHDSLSKHRYIEILCYKILGFTKVKLSKPELYMYDKIDELEQYSNPEDYLMLENSAMKLIKYSLPFNNDYINLYFMKYGIYVDFIMEQYSYKNIVNIEPDDIVLDCGACWGDTALYFASKSAEKVYSFEFIESNCEIFNKNISMNPKLKDKINLIKSPLWSQSDINLSYEDTGPSSRVGEEGLYSNEVKTLSIDDFVHREKLTKVDFIKMDIEGAELDALKGAKASIRAFKPKLAICVYHKPDDMILIPKYIKSLNPDYKFYFDYYTNVGWEFVLYAV